MTDKTELKTCEARYEQ